MNPEEKIRSAFSDLRRRSRQDVDARDGLASLQGRRRRGLVPALVSAGAVTLAVGGFALLGLLSGEPVPDDDIVAPPSTVATTTTTPGTTIPAFVAGPGMAGWPFVVAETVDGQSAGLLGQPPLVELPGEILSAHTDTMGGVVYLTGTDLMWATGQGESVEIASGVDALAGVYISEGMPSALYATSTGGSSLTVTSLSPDPEMRTSYDVDLEWVEGRVLDIDVDGSNLAVIAERDGCRWVLIARDFTAGSPQFASIDRGTCMAQQDGWPRAVAISGQRVVVAESASAGEIEFTHDEIATYDLGGQELSRKRIDTFLDIDVVDVDLDGTKALIAAEYLWVLDTETGSLVEVSDPFRTGQAILRATWTTVSWRFPNDPGAIAFRVTGVAGDDVLNVRTEPDPSSSIIARLAPGYAAIGDTGETSLASDGGKWRRVTLLDPVRLQNLGEPLHGGPPIGWVNEAFLETLTERLPVDSSEVPLCAGPTTPSAPGSGETPDHIYSMWIQQVEDCLRIVVTLGTGFDPSFPAYDAITTEPRPSTGVPRFEVSSSGHDVTVNFPGITQVWQFGTDRNGAFAVRESDGSLSVTVLTRSDSVTVTPLPGRIVVDITGATPAMPVNLVAVAPAEATPDGEITITGVARPFEATLGIELTDASGNPVVATFEGSSFLGTSTDSRYAVMTTDYIEAWGRFSFTVSGLDPGSYTLLMSGDGADVPAVARFEFDVG